MKILSECICTNYFGNSRQSIDNDACAPRSLSVTTCPYPYDIQSCGSGSFRLVYKTNIGNIIILFYTIWK